MSRCEDDMSMVKTLDDNPEMAEAVLEDDRWVYNEQYKCYVRRDIPKAKQPLLERIKSKFVKKG